MDWNSIFTFDLDLGKAYWKIKPNKNMRIGEEAGGPTPEGYIQVGYKTKHYRLHRILLEQVLGRELRSDEQVDHINGNTGDNRKCNLRLADSSTNGCNSKLDSRNKYGVKGLCQTKRNKKGKVVWQARIDKDGKSKCKYFPLTEIGKLEAIQWLRHTRPIYHREFTNHGKHTGVQ